MAEDITYKTVELVGDEISLPSEVLISHEETTIEPFNFVDCTELVNVVIPDSIETIGAGAFWGCTGLTHVEIPQSVYFIDECAFKDCTNLKRINIPYASYVILPAVFSYCENLNDVNMPFITEIHDNTFEFCSSLEHIDLDYVYKIGPYAFVGCENLKSVSFKDDIEIMKNAFFGCTSLHSLELPYNADASYAAFANCTNLEYAVIGPNDYENRAIANGLFMNCTSLKEVTIHPNCKYIYKDAFLNCTSLKTIKYMGNRTDWEAIDKYDGWNTNTHPDLQIVCLDDTTKWYYYNGNVYEEALEGTFTYNWHNTQCYAIEFGCSITNLGPRSMHNCENIREIFLTNKIKTISYFAMLNCKNLADIWYEGTIAEWEAIEKHETTITTKEGKTIKYPDWREGIATSEALKGKFTVHCTDGDVNYSNDEFYIICVDNEYNTFKPGAEPQPYDFLYAEVHHEIVYKAPEINIDGYRFIGQTMYANVLYLQYEKIKTDDETYEEVSTEEYEFLKENEVIVNPKDNTNGMPQAQILENSLLNNVCWIFFGENFLIKDIDVLCENILEHGEHPNIVEKKRKEIRDFVGYRLYSEVKFYKIYNESNKTYRNYGIEYVRFDDNNRATLVKEFEWKIDGCNMSMNYLDSRFEDRYFGIYKVYDDYIDITEPY